jgi:hypothetical protein
MNRQAAVKAGPEGEMMIPCGNWQFAAGNRPGFVGLCRRFFSNQKLGFC